MKLLDYIRGLRKGKEAYRLEKESMKDPFLADAMDGYRQVEGNHELEIEQLKKQISAHSCASKRKNTFAIVWSVAACLLIGFGISTYFLFLKPEEMTEVSLLISKNTESETSVTQNEKPAKTVANQDSIQIITLENAKKRDIIAKRQETSEEKMVMMKEESAPTSMALSATRQNNRITGKVIGEKSDLNETVEIAIDTCNSLLIAMNESKQELNEVVITRYGSNKKSTITGSVSSISRSNKKERLHTPDPVIGRRKYREYLEESLIRPTDEECKDVEGKVTLSFFVGKDGNPHRIVVLKGLCKSADKEAIRLIKEGPKWTSGILPVEIKVKF